MRVRVHCVSVYAKPVIVTHNNGILLDRNGTFLVFLGFDYERN